MKRILTILFLALAVRASSQLAVNTMIPPVGLMEKQQLWNILVTNPGMSAVNIRIELVLTEVNTGQQVLGATTGIINVPPGTKQLSAGSIGAVQYNVTGGTYRVDPGPAGLLPVGVFKACYSFIEGSGKPMAQECHQLNIQPLSPLLLNLPAHHSVLDNRYPSFSWIPFSSAQFLNNLSYNIKLVEVYQGQSAADAMQKNPPLFTARNITSTNLLYAQSAPALEQKKQYAWQVTAVNNLTEIARSETWDFSLGTSGGGMLKPDPVYVRLKKEPEDAGYGIFYGNLRFAYFNETGDTTWNVKLTDISSGKPQAISMAALDTLKMERGENLVNIPGSGISGLRDKHIYLMQLSNSRRETWQLKFEYRKEDQ
jgi:hypothetical protein